MIVRTMFIHLVVNDFDIQQGVWDGPGLQHKLQEQSVCHSEGGGIPGVQIPRALRGQHMFPSTKVDDTVLLTGIRR